MMHGQTKIKSIILICFNNSTYFTLCIILDNKVTVKYLFLESVEFGTAQCTIRLGVCDIKSRRD